MVKLYGILLAIVGFIASILFANWSGKKQGKEEERNNQNQNTIKSIKKANEIKAKNSKLSKSDIINGL